MGMGGQRHAPAALLPGKKPGTYCIGGWVGPRASLDGCGKSRPPTGFDSRTVQPVASRHTDWAIAAHRQNIVATIIWRHIHIHSQQLKGQPATCTNYRAVLCEFTKPNFILKILSCMSRVGNGRPLIDCRFAVSFHGKQIKISGTIAPKHDNNKRQCSVYFGSCNVKCGAGDGWRRSVGPIMWEMKKCYLEWMSRGISYMK